MALAAAFLGATQAKPAVPLRAASGLAVVIAAMEHAPAQQASLLASFFQQILIDFFLELE